MKLALRFVRRELRTAEARILVLALALAVASVGAVGLFADRVKGAFAQQANVLLGADALIAGDRPLPENLRQQATALGLRTTASIRFGSMVSSADGGAALSDVKAIEAPYPLRGHIEVRRSASDRTRIPLDALPQPGEVFIDERLAQRLGVSVGQTVQLGLLEPRVAQVFVEEPEVAGNFLTASPKVLMHHGDLEASQLLGPGSRATWRLQVAGAQAQAFVDSIKPRLGPGQRLETVREMRPEVRNALQRAEQFLGLAASFAVFLAVVAIVLSLRRYLKRELHTATLFRTLGAGRRQTLRHFLVQFALLALLASLLGIALAWLAQAALAALLSGLFASELPPAGALPLVKAFATGLLLMLGFALPPLVALAATPPVRALRSEVPQLERKGLFATVLGIAAVLAVVLLQAQDGRTGVIFVLGISALVLAATALALGVLWLIRRLLRNRRGSRSGRSPWLFGLANLDRRRLSTAIQMACLALGVMTLITVGFVRTDLFTAWQRSLPADAPNRFLINIQPEQVEPIRTLITQGTGQHSPIYPMVRGRLVAVNGQPVSAADYSEDRARRLVDREFNLSAASAPPAGNHIVAGAYFQPGETAVMSLEQGIAQTLGLQLDDRVTFDIAGERLEVRITSLRSVDWDSFRANFFALLPPETVATLPKSYLTAFHMPSENNRTLNAIIAEAPNVLVIDISEIMERVRSIIDQVAQALEFVFAFTLAAGLLTLYTAILATQDERRHDTALIRTLGGTRRQVRNALIAEFTTLGLCAGLLGVLGAIGLTWALASRILRIDFVGSPGVWLVGLIAATLCTLAAGWLGTRSALSTPPIRVLREMS